MRIGHGAWFNWSIIYYKHKRCTNVPCSERQRSHTNNIMPFDCFRHRIWKCKCWCHAGACDAIGLRIRMLLVPSWSMFSENIKCLTKQMQLITFNNSPQLVIIHSHRLFAVWFLFRPTNYIVRHFYGFKWQTKNKILIQKTAITISESMHVLFVYVFFMFPSSFVIENEKKNAKICLVCMMFIIRILILMFQLIVIFFRIIHSIRSIWMYRRKIKVDRAVSFRVNRIFLLVFVVPVVS